MGVGGFGKADHSLVVAKRRQKNQNAQENGHNFGMIKDVFIKFVMTSF